MSVARFVGNLRRVLPRRVGLVVARLVLERDETLAQVREVQLRHFDLALEQLEPAIAQVLDVRDGDVRREQRLVSARGLLALRLRLCGLGRLALLLGALLRRELALLEADVARLGCSARFGLASRTRAERCRRSARRPCRRSTDRACSTPHAAAKPRRHGAERADGGQRKRRTASHARCWRMLNYVNRSRSMPLRIPNFWLREVGCAAIFATYLSLHGRGVPRRTCLGTPYGSSATP